MEAEEIIANWREVVSKIDERSSVNKQISRSKLIKFFVDKKAMNEPDATKYVDDAIENGTLIKVNGSLKLSDNSKNKLIQIIKKNNPNFDESVIWKRISQANDRVVMARQRKNAILKFYSTFDKKANILEKIPIKELLHILNKTAEIGRMYVENKPFIEVEILKILKKILSYELDQKRDSVSKEEIKKIAEGYGIAI